MRYISLTLITLLLIYGSYETDIDKITPWLLGINFTLALFSINFTFFGYQLSKYKAIYNKLSKRQWFNIIAILVLPFIPLISFLVAPEHFGKIALWILPFLIFSAIDNALLTIKYLNAQLYIEDKFTGRSISKYLKSLSKEIKKESILHKSLLENRKKFQMPVDSYHFEPTTLGLSTNDIWDSITVIIKLSIKNNDYPVFRLATHAILKLVFASHSFKFNSDYEKSYMIDGGVKTIARKRLRLLINSIVNESEDSIFLHTLSNELCNYIANEEEMVIDPCSDFSKAIISDARWIGEKLLESKTSFEPHKTLNTIHTFIEVVIHHLETKEKKEDMDGLNKINISIYVHEIKALGVSALESGNPHFAYRCMEDLSYLGCNAAKLKSRETVGVVFECIVHLGRLARNLGIGCFWNRCLIPSESHAEEFMGHIVTWLIKDIDNEGDFYMKGYAEQAYSRLRGVQCLINPLPNSRPCNWINEIVRDGKPIPHIEKEMGMYGYNGKLDYSDYSNLKEYKLHGFGIGGEVINTPPIPLKFEEVD